MNDQPDLFKIRTRHDEIRESFEKFLTEHPKVWDLFVQFTFDRIRIGFKHYSAYAIVERIRWETDQAHTNGEMFKVSNNHRPFFGRKFMDDYPDFAPKELGEDGFFRIRKQTSKDAQPTNLPEITPHDLKERLS